MAVRSEIVLRTREVIGQSDELPARALRTIRTNCPAFRANRPTTGLDRVAPALLQLGDTMITKMRAVVATIALSTSVSLALGCDGRRLDRLVCHDPSCAFSSDEWRRLGKLSPLPEPPADHSNRYRDLPAAIKLGAAFFSDARFSGPATQVNALGQPSAVARAPLGRPAGVACATCHDLGRAGIDATSVPGNISEGAGWTDVNALSIVNNVYNRLWFRNGRADSAWAVSVGVAESPTTMNGDRMQTAWVIADAYRDYYDALFGPDGYSLPLRGQSSDLSAMLDPSGHCPMNGVCPDGCRLNGVCLPKFPLHGKPGRIAGCQLDSSDEPFGDAWDCMDAGDQEAVKRVLVNWAKALDAYQAIQISGETPFDRFIREGPESPAISSSAKRGARLFVGKAACIDCHGGPLFSDGDFHNVGAPQSGPGVPRVEDCRANTACDCVNGVNCLPFGAWDGLDKLTGNKYLRSSPFSDDPGDMSRADELARARTARTTDALKGAWRTPSLREVAVTGPYMHDGIYETLADVVRHYSRGGNPNETVGQPAVDIKPLGLTPDEQADLVAFLETLTADRPPQRMPNAGDAGAADAAAAFDGSRRAIDAPVADALGPPVEMELATFDISTEGFAFDLYNDPTNLAANPGPVAPALTWDPNEGAPTPGALRATVPFSDYFQSVFIRRATPNLQNWTGRTLRARVRLASGFNPDPAFPSGAQIYVQTTPSYFFDGAFFELALTTEWQEIAFAVDSADEPLFDAQQVISYGIELTTGDGGRSAPGGGPTGDAGIASALPMPAVVFIDSITLE